jgi:LysR family transcriptional regulator, glycine cleavage system transcriptional activator
LATPCSFFKQSMLQQTMPSLRVPPGDASQLLSMLHEFGYYTPMLKLPPFDALVALDSVVRTGSMTRAAAELGLTQSAVSHRIRRLEGYMGVKLVNRSPQRLTPTVAGEALVAGLSELIAGFSELRSRCIAAATPHRMRVGVGAALADNWLVQRMPKFAATHPDVTVEIVIVERDSPEVLADLDLQIVWVPAEELCRTSTQTPLFQERVFPVCHPSLLPQGFRAEEPGILTKLPLLRKSVPNQKQGAEWDWSTWFNRLGLCGTPEERICFTSIGPAIAAAERAAGVVLARSMLVCDALADGRLTRVLPATFDMVSGKAHIVRWPPSRSGNRRLTAFTRWLTSAAKETVAGGMALPDPTT